MLYRLTERAADLFPTVSNALTLELLQMTQKIYGATAPEKLLMLVFQNKTEQYKAQLKGTTTQERAASLARLREAEGCMSEVEQTPENGLAIVEHHSPVMDVLVAFPIVAKLEETMFQQLLQKPVKREEDRVSGLFRATFRIGA
jgi:predicted ArsR family transcriptional regulator